VLRLHLRFTTIHFASVELAVGAFAGMVHLLSGFVAT